MREALSRLGVSVIVRRGDELYSLPPTFPDRYCFELCLLQYIGITIALLGPWYTAEPYISPPRSLETQAGSNGATDFATGDGLDSSSGVALPTPAKEDSDPSVEGPPSSPTYVIAAAYGGTAANGGSYTQLCLSAWAASFLTLTTIGLLAFWAAIIWLPKYICVRPRKC